MPRLIFVRKKKNDEKRKVSSSIPILVPIIPPFSCFSTFLLGPTKNISINRVSLVHARAIPSRVSAIFYRPLSRNEEGRSARQIETFIRKAGCVTARRSRFITRANGKIYLFGEQMNTKTNFRRPSRRAHSARSFSNFCSRTARRVIVKYDYSVSRRLFLTPGSPPSSPPPLPRATRYRRSPSIGAVHRTRAEDPIKLAFERCYRSNPAG